MKISQFISAALLAASIVSCNKQNKDTAASSSSTSTSPTGSVTGELTGTWKVVKHAYDENYNLTIDPDEWEIPDPAYSGTLTINPDGTGSTLNTFTGQPNDTNTFTWARLSTTEISSKAPSGYNYFGKLAYIEKLTATELVLIDTARLNTQWELQWHFFKR
ncbi:MAG: lipocalin family protein [Taibaiella sp.]|nr:lipocalin family protein [Taibaiella sp.]